MNLPTALTSPSKKRDQPPADWYALTTNAKKTTASIYLYGVIGGYRVNVNNFLDDLRNAGDVHEITIYLNTVGGTFLDGLPIYNTLKQHSAHVTVKVMGYSLSMGSIIMLAADSVECAENGLIMIHRAQGGVRGDASDLRKGADILEKHENAALIPEFMRRMSKSEDEVRALLAAETWYTAQEAKAAGLIDKIIGAVDLDEAEESLADNAWEHAAETFKNPHSAFSARFEQHIEHANKKPLLTRLINKVLGAPAQQPDDASEETEDMTPEQIAALAAAMGEVFTTALNESNAKLIESNDKLLESMNDLKGDFVTAELESTEPEESEEVTALKAQLATAQAKIDELSEPEPATPRTVNAGPTDESDGWDQATNTY